MFNKILYVVSSFSFLFYGMITKTLYTEELYVELVMIIFISIIAMIVHALDKIIKEGQIVNLRELEITIGSSIEDAYNKLYKEKSKNCFIKFNGKQLYSTDSLDEMFVKVTGQTKKEFDKARAKERLELIERDKEHERKIPQLTKEWVEKGKLILTEDKWEYWEKIVPIRLKDLYKGMELGCCLEIIEILKTGNKEKAKQVLYDQGHSGMLHSLVCHMITALYEEGYIFVESAK